MSTMCKPDLRPLVALMLAGSWSAALAAEPARKGQIQYPGVYVQESASAPKPIPGVSTAVAGRPPARAEIVQRHTVPTLPRPASAAQPCAKVSDPRAGCPVAR